VNRKSRRAQGKNSRSAPVSWQASARDLFLAAFRCHQEGRLAEADVLYRQVLKQDSSHADSLHWLGVMAAQLGRPEQAVALLRQAIGLRGDDPLFHSNLGNALQESDRLTEAIAAYGDALRLRPAFHEALSNLANALSLLGRQEAAKACARRALVLHPSFAEAANVLAVALTEGWQLTDAFRLYCRALLLVPGRAEAHSNLLMCQYYDPASDEARHFYEACLFARRYGPARPSPHFANLSAPDRRLRIGYVSGDFHTHPVGHLLHPVLSCHDPAQFEIFCYSNGTKMDAMTARLQGEVPHWRSLTGLSDHEAAAQIQADAIDILVDLSGHTGRNRLPMFALKPAPIQASWLGYWGTTGLPAMDYLLTDAVTVPPGQERWYSEKLVRLPRGRFCFAPPPDTPELVDAPSQTEGPLTFGSFNNLAKIGPAVVTLWCAILRELPGTRLVLKWATLEDPRVRQRVIDAFLAGGIKAERLDLRGNTPHAEMLAEYGDVDIALDPFPFSGGMTSCEALWMGVPVVTRPGPNPSSRQTFGFLQSLGLQQWAATDADDYRRIALELAAQSVGRKATRQKLRERVLSGSLCDAPGFTRHLEQAFRLMWRRYCGASPDQLDPCPVPGPE